MKMINKMKRVVLCCTTLSCCLFIGNNKCYDKNAVEDIIVQGKSLKNFFKTLDKYIFT